MLIFTSCIHGFMSNLIKKSWTDSTTDIFLPDSMVKAGFPSVAKLVSNLINRSEKTKSSCDKGRKVPIKIGNR